MFQKFLPLKNFIYDTCITHMSKQLSTGSRAQVMHGTAKKTSGGLTKSDLKYNKQGRIVSKKKSALAKKAIKKQLFDKGYKPVKGEFVLFSKAQKSAPKKKKAPVRKYKTGEPVGRQLGALRKHFLATYGGLTTAAKFDARRTKRKALLRRTPAGVKKYMSKDGPKKYDLAGFDTKPHFYHTLGLKKPKRGRPKKVGRPKKK
jgi:hypothetical protein